VPAGFLSFVFAWRPWRDWFAGYLTHVLVAALFTLPVLFFNYERGFAPLRFQWDHATCTEGNGLASLGEFLGVQSLMVGFLPLLVLAWIVFNLRSVAVDPRLRVCTCLFAVPYCVFLFKASRGPVEGNWPLACYLGLWPLAAQARETIRRRWFILSILVPLVSTTLLTGHLLEPLPMLSPSRDRISRQQARNELLCEIANTIRRERPDLSVFVPTYQMAAGLRYHGIEAQQLDGLSRPSHFTQTPRLLTDEQEALVVTEGPLPPEHTVGFGPPIPVRSFPLVVRGETVSRYHILLFRRSR
jgi:hypothetical protein